MSIFGAIAARVPDWSINFAENFDIGGSNWTHRSVYTHSILGIVLFGILVAISLILVDFLRERLGKVNTMPKHVVLIILMAAFLTHIVTDMLEAYPIRFLYPFSSREFSGWIPSSLYQNNIFVLVIWIIGFGTAIVLSITELMKTAK
jgi:membrane-bound metal-dependent hydrolase YbcI (DUF457 family)